MRIQVVVMIVAFAVVVGMFAAAWPWRGRRRPPRDPALDRRDDEPGTRGWWRC